MKIKLVAGGRRPLTATMYALCTVTEQDSDGLTLIVALC